MLRRALLAAAVTLVACSRSHGGEAAGKQSAGPTHVKLALNWVPEPEFGGFYAAKVAGAYDRAKLDVDILGGGAGVPIVQMVATGQVDFGIAGGDDVILARARGLDVVAVFGTFQTSPQGLMVHASRGLRSLADVFRSGLTLALEPGIPYAAFLKRKFGFGGVTIVPYDGGVARFLADPTFAQQCYVTSEPIAARQKGSDPRVFLVAESGYEPYGAVVVTRQALLDGRPELVRSFVAASAEGWRAYLADPKPANAAMGRLNPAMDQATFAAAAEAERPLVETDAARREGLGTMARERWETLARQLAELGLVEKAPAADALFRQVLPNSAAAIPPR